MARSMAASCLQSRPRRSVRFSTRSRSCAAIARSLSALVMLAGSRSAIASRSLVSSSASASAPGSRPRPRRPAKQARPRWREPQASRAARAAAPLQTSGQAASPSPPAPARCWRPAGKRHRPVGQRLSEQSPGKGFGTAHRGTARRRRDVRAPLHAARGTERTGPPIPGTFDDCPRCDTEALNRRLRSYADHGARSTRKSLGMSFPSGSTIPTPEDTAWAHVLLDEMGIPR